MERRVFCVFRTHHGPIVRAQDGNWISVALMANSSNKEHQQLALLRCGQVPLLRGWDRKWAIDSPATALANRVGRNQPTATPDRRHCSTVRRFGTQPSGRLCFRPCIMARETYAKSISIRHNSKGTPSAATTPVSNRTGFGSGRLAASVSWAPARCRQARRPSAR